MAAKKKNPKKAASKPTPKKATKKAVKKTAVKKVAKKVAKPAKKSAPKKSAPAKKKAAPKKVTPAKKKAVTKKAAPKKAAPAKKKVVTKKAAPKKATPAKKKVVTKKAAPKKVAPAKGVVKKTAPAKKIESVKKTTPAKKEAPAKPTAPAKPKGPVKLTVFAKKQRQRLLDLRDELVDAMSGVAGEIKDAASGSDASGGGMHQGDAGSDAYDRDFALSMLSKEQDALYEIEQALKRVDRGAYGICEISGAKIPQPRLEVLPFARLTVDCQAKWEKDNGNQRFRPASEIGFSNGYFPNGEDSPSVSLDGND